VLERGVGVLTQLSTGSFIIDDETSEALAAAAAWMSVS